MMYKDNKKPRYNINLVVRETGIKADTLRAWERRYKLPQPARSAGGHRLFSDYDIEMIKWLLARQAEGLRINLAVELWRELEANGEDPLDSAPVDQFDHNSPLAVEPQAENLRV